MKGYYQYLCTGIIFDVYSQKEINICNDAGSITATSYRVVEIR